MCVSLSFEFVGGSNVCACGKAAHPAWSSRTHWPCQRKLWSEESANRAWCTSPETRIIGNWETTASSHPPANAGQELLFQFQPPDLPTLLTQLSFQSRACLPPARSWPTTPVTSGLLTLPLTSPLWISQSSRSQALVRSCCCAKAICSEPSLCCALSSVGAYLLGPLHGIKII